MKYYSEETKSFYNSAEECEKTEKEALEEKNKKAEKEKELKETRATRAKEVEDAFNKANELLNNFIKDYGSFHYTYSHRSPFNDLFDNFLLRW